jgi:hypothetical protein
MADTRPTYKPNSDAQRIIDELQFAYPVSISSVTDAINYALRFVSEHDQKLIGLGETPDGPGRYFVGHYFPNPQRNKRREFNDREEAREYFHKYEIDARAGRMRSFFEDRQTGQKIMLPRE